MTPQPPPTRSSLLPEARYLVLPKGIASSGFPRVEATCMKIGIRFDDWQAGLNRCILAKTPDGLFAADTVVLSIARQVGKTFDIGAVAFAECIAEPDTTVVWTAHRFKVSRETFNELRALAKSPLLAPHIDYDAITTAAGNECIPFRNGSRIVFAARERGAIRGFTKVRILILDEAQILTDHVLADLVPTMNQATNPLIILMGTPPKPTDPGEVFTGLRTDALSGESEGVLYAEFSADPGSNPDDRKAWRDANPSFPQRTPARAILRMRKLLSDDDFCREALGIWDGAAGDKLVIPLAFWDACADPESIGLDPVAFAVDVDPDRAWSSIIACGLRADGLPTLSVVNHDRGTDWVVPRLVELYTRWNPGAIVLDKAGPVGSLIPGLVKAGITPLLPSTQDVVQACGAFYDAAVVGRLRHRNHPVLNDALKGAKKRALRDAWAWDRKSPGVDISPIVAATLALWARQSPQFKTNLAPLIFDLDDYRS